MTVPSIIETRELFPVQHILSLARLLAAYQKQQFKKARHQLERATGHPTARCRPSFVPYAGRTAEKVIATAAVVNPIQEATFSEYFLSLDHAYV